MKSIAAALGKIDDGGVIVLLDCGEYAVGALAVKRANRRWITVAADAGLRPEQVVICPSKRDIVRPGVRLLHWQGVSFDFDRVEQYYPEPGQHVWFDYCRWFNSAGWAATYIPDQLQPVRSRSAIGGSYATDCQASDMLYGFVDQTLVRHCALRRISSDALQNSSLVLNCTVDTMDTPISGTHNDILQYFGHHENVIVYGVKATAICQTQDIFLDKTDSAFANCAFVDIEVSNPQSDPPFSQLASAEDHVLFSNVRTPDQSWVFRTDLGLRPHNVFLENCGVRRFLSRPPAGVIVRQGRAQ